MNAPALFGLIVRSVGLAVGLWGVYYAVLAVWSAVISLLYSTITFERWFFSDLAPAIGFIAGGIAIIKGAEHLVSFAYPTVRVRPVACAKCGYDLRATPGRCPECGTAPGADPKIPLASVHTET